MLFKVHTPGVANEVWVSNLGAAERVRDAMLAAGLPGRMELVIEEDPRVLADPSTVRLGHAARRFSQALREE